MFAEKNFSGAVIVKGWSVPSGTIGDGVVKDVGFYSSTDNVDYKDDKGNPISKTQYDSLVAQSKNIQPKYTDAAGTVITKAQYDELMVFAQNKGLSGFGDFGFSLKSAVKAIVNPIAAVQQTVAQVKRTVAQAPKIVQQVIKAPVTIAQLTASKVVKPVLTFALKTATNPVESVQTAAQQIGRTLGVSNVQQKIAAPEKAMTIGTMITSPTSMIQSMQKKPQAQAQQTADGGVQYVDENGNPITKAQYDAIMAQYNTQSSTGQTNQQVQYLDDKGNVITKAQYDALMAQGPQYQDENGNTITKAQYDAIMAQYATQASQSPSTSNVSTVSSKNIPSLPVSQQSMSSGANVQSTPVSMTASSNSSGAVSSGDSGGGGDAILDQLSQQVYNVLLQLRSKAQSGTLTAKEKDFVNFMVSAIGSSNQVTISGFGEMPIWNRSLPLNSGYQTEEGELVSDTDRVEKIPLNVDYYDENFLPSFNEHAPGVFSQEENFAGMEGI